MWSTISDEPGSAVTAMPASSENSPANTLKSAQHRALFFREQLIAPVERSAERLVPGQRGPSAARQEPEPIVQMRRQVPHTKTPTRAAASSSASGIPSSRRQISRTAGTSASAEHELVHRRRGAFVEQLYGRVAQRLGGEHDRIRRKLQRCQAMQRFALCPQRLAAGRQNADAGSGLEQRLRQRGRRANDVLAAIEHEQRGLVAQPRGQRPRVVAA